MQPSERAPVTSQRRTPAAWMAELRGWFSRRMATRRGRATLAGAGVVAVAATGLAIMFAVGVFSSPSEQARGPVASPSPSGQVRDPDASASPAAAIDIPVDAAFQMTATNADAIGVAADTEFVLTS